MNKANFDLTLNHIETHLKEWDQTKWHDWEIDLNTPAPHACGTTHCFAGTADILAGNPLPDWFIELLKDPIKPGDYPINFHAYNEESRQRAQDFLDLTDDESDYLFDSDRTLEDFRNFSRTGIIPVTHDDE